MLIYANRTSKHRYCYYETIPRNASIRIPQRVQIVYDIPLFSLSIQRSVVACAFIMFAFSAMWYRACADNCIYSTSSELMIFQACTKCIHYDCRRRLYKLLARMKLKVIKAQLRGSQKIRWTGYLKCTYFWCHIIAIIGCMWQWRADKTKDLRLRQRTFYKKFTFLEANAIITN